MKFRLEINLENNSIWASGYDEIGMILMRDITDIIEECKKKRNEPDYFDYYHHTMDMNGNSIGQWSIKHK